MQSARPLLLCALACLALAPSRALADRTLIEFERRRLTDVFHCEGAHIGDFDHDGDPDVVSGPYWYAGPEFTERHEYRAAKAYPPAGYSDNFLTFTHDVSGDGWTDIIIIDHPGIAAAWYENPGKTAAPAAESNGHWTRHVIHDVVDNESPGFGDVDGDGRPELLFHTGGRFGFASYDPAKPREKWAFHAVSGQLTGGRYEHGFGFGDVNGDGRVDLLFKRGWIEQPEGGATSREWTFREVVFAPQRDDSKDGGYDLGKHGMGGAQMHVYDFDGDGDNDVLTSIEAHAWGLAWHENLGDDGKGGVAFRMHVIQGSKPEHNAYGVCYTQMHAIDLRDMDGDGVADVVTGKRWWAHNGNDPGGNEPAVLYWYRTVRRGAGDVDFVPYKIDGDSGVGTQVITGDVNGDGFPDIVVGNKKGTFVTLQKRRTVSDEEWRAAQPKRVAGLDVRKRSRVATSAGSGRFHAVTTTETWDPAKSAVIVCDMWDSHHCLNAVRRATEMAPRMNEVLEEARALGFLVIHAPSSCMAPYEGHPARERAKSAPRAANLPEGIADWCHSIPQEEQGAYPIDQSDGGEDDDAEEHRQWAEKLASMGLNPRAPWKRQIGLLRIDERDAISDSGVEIWSLLEQRGIDNVVILGVHTNMCVLGRPFGLRQMAKNGKNVVLMRDMTDTMYNPARAPYVSHFTGTDLIVEHIEKWVCPTITSRDFLGGKEFRFSKDRRPHVVFVVAEDEYHTEETLPAFATAHLGKHFRTSFVFGSETSRNDIPGLAALADADLLIMSIRRRPLPPAQLDVFRRHLDAGKPLVAIRTSSHAFALRDNAAPAEGLMTWQRFDPDVLGGNYSGHHSNGGEDKPPTIVRAESANAAHPILSGLADAEFAARSSLYKASPLESGTTPLLTGTVGGEGPAQPVAWTHDYRGARVFYTSLGHVGDFETPAFRRLLWNAIFWALERDAPELASSAENSTN